MWALTVRRSLKLITFALFSTSFSFSLHQQPSCGVLRRREERSLSKTRLQVLPSTQSLEGLVVIYTVAHMNSFFLECGEHKWTKQLASEKWIEATVQGISWFAPSLTLYPFCIHVILYPPSTHLQSFWHWLIVHQSHPICSHLIQVMGQSTQQQATLTHPAYYTQVLT